MLFFSSSVERAKSLSVEPEIGLRSQQVEGHRLKYGTNRLPEKPQRSIFSIFAESLRDKTLLILVAAAFVSIGVEVIRVLLNASYEAHYVDGIAILLAVLVASGVSTINDYRAGLQFSYLSKIRDDFSVTVLRDGEVALRSVHDIVVGDIVRLSTGDRVPADGVLLQGVDVLVDQSTLTGESEPVAKGQTDLAMLAGSSVVQGNGSLLVTDVGLRSELGRLYAELDNSNARETPLQARLSVLADRIGYIGLSAAILTFVALVISTSYRGQIGSGFEIISNLLEFAIVAITIVVVAVPEGLPLAVTISLAYSVRKMAADHNLVRRLVSCETMGAATVICSDKTGTLTHNRMKVIDGWVGGKRLGAAPEKDAYVNLAAEQIAKLASINSTAYIDESKTNVSYIGNPTEAALLAWISAWGTPWQKLRDEAEIISQASFTSDRKRMSTLVGQGTDEAVLYIKGAPEIVLSRSKYICDENGVREITEDDHANIQDVITTFAKNGLRALALAYRQVDSQVRQKASDEGVEAFEDGLVLLTIVALADPVRDEIPDAVDSCRHAGVEVKMVTGDHVVTATSIARQIGLLESDSIIMEGEEFRKTSEDELKPKLGRLKVLARSVPSDKLRLVQLLQEEGHVVAVTGDGTNDAPALKGADVGFSMGQSGTEVAKEASDIVLLDDNFASIVNAVSWGRAIFRNVRKFLQFQLTVNVVALATTFLSAILGFGIALTTVQLLWVNLIMDTLAALALATEPPSADLLREKPHGRHEPLISKAMWSQIFGIGAFMLLVLLGILTWSDQLFPNATPAQRLTLVFNVFVFLQLFNEINARSVRVQDSPWTGLGRSPIFAMVLGVTVLLQFAIVQWGGMIFRTTPITAQMWIISIVLGASVLGVSAAIRMFGRQLPTRSMNLVVET